MSLVRNIVGVLVGFLAAAFVVMVGFLGGMLLLGREFVLEPGGYNASVSWLVVSSFITIIGGIIGGLCCMLITGRTRAYTVLAAIIFVMGVAGGILGSGRPEPPARPDEQGVMELMQQLEEHGREPLYTRITNPIYGAGGVLLAGLLAARVRRARTESP
ncbi:MAG: hypothetical protein KC996_05340 [Phycisphaerales bacterium]|nr:hypothetical protein [Phycisphaerales bacterium]